MTIDRITPREARVPKEKVFTRSMSMVCKLREHATIEEKSTKEEEDKGGGYTSSF